MIMKTVLARPVLWRKEGDKIKKFTVYYDESVIYALTEWVYYVSLWYFGYL